MGGATRGRTKPEEPKQRAESCVRRPTTKQLPAHPCFSHTTCSDAHPSDSSLTHTLKSGLWVFLAAAERLPSSRLLTPHRSPCCWEKPRPAFLESQIKSSTVTHLCWLLTRPVSQPTSHPLPPPRVRVQVRLAFFQTSGTIRCHWNAALFIFNNNWLLLMLLSSLLDAPTHQHFTTFPSVGAEGLNLWEQSLSSGSIQTSAISLTF